MSGICGISYILELPFVYLEHCLDDIGTLAVEFRFFYYLLGIIDFHRYIVVLEHVAVNLLDELILSDEFSAVLVLALKAVDEILLVSNVDT